MIRSDQWHPVDGLVLEPNAMSAVTMLDENVVVAAGPGAGKTELLAQRADFLLRTGQCPYPRRILAVSFKVDAARNLRERVRRRSGSRLAARFDSFTFHAFAKRVIDNFRPALTGYNALNPDYRIDPDTRIEGEQITFATWYPWRWRSSRPTPTPKEASARHTATSSSTSSRTAPGISTS